MKVELLPRNRITVDGGEPMPVQRPANDALGLVVYEHGKGNRLTAKPLDDADADLVHVAKAIPGVVGVRDVATGGALIDYPRLPRDLLRALGRVSVIDAKTREIPGEVHVAFGRKMIVVPAAAVLALWSAVRAVERGDVQLVLCPNCERFWFGKRHGDLCDRLIPGRGITCEQQGAYQRMKSRSDWPKLYRAMYARVLRQTLPRPVFDLWNQENRPAATDEPLDVDTWVGTRGSKPRTPVAEEARRILDEWEGGRYWMLRAAREEAAAKRKEEA